MSSLSRPATLLILDGWNLGRKSDTNAVHLARTPHLDKIMTTHPWTRIASSGLEVGLPDGQMGNSEVGHLNLGAGRVVDQEITRIDKSIRNGELGRNPAWLELLEKVSGNQSTLHLLGLVSDGGVHSSLGHLEALIRRAAGRRKVRLHAFLDGRDTSPKAGTSFMRRIQGWAEEINTAGGDFAVASIGGRYWGMDRDKRWDRIEKHWRTLVLGKGPTAQDPVHAIEESYESGVTDEFIRPVVLVDGAGLPLGRIRDGDGVFFFNFRADRARQITRALTDEYFDGFRRDYFPRINFATMTQYHRDFEIPIAFPPKSLEGIFADVLAAQGLKNLRLAESEKYAHVTFFFNGGVEAPWPGEDRILVPSPHVATYDLQPEMSLPKIVSNYLDQVQNGGFDAHVVNFANCDMVGHTGVLSAAIKAVEAVDKAVGEVVEAALDMGGFLIVTADHGNAEKMWDEETKGPHTQHTTTPVPMVLVDPKWKGGLGPGRLSDLVPTLLSHAGLEPDARMTGRDLRIPAPATKT
jgi:2,3-bisphosphoglycerate-independent phosphoglycerate mutase